MSRHIPRILTTMTLALALSASFGVASASADQPSGQRMIGNTSFSFATMTFTGGGGVVEPAYDDTTGNLVYLLTPNNAKSHPNAHNVAPLYLPVYPVGSGIDPTMLNCQHLTLTFVLHENCPDHGMGVAFLTQTVYGVPGVYDKGVLGHDHLVGIASTGGDFNVLWEPTLVLFNSVADAIAVGHITLLSQITTAEANGQAYEVPLAFLDFHCSSVSAAVYNGGTPAPVLGP